MSLQATHELAQVLGVEPLELLHANRDRPWMEEEGTLVFGSLRPGDVLRNPRGGEVEIVSMGGTALFGQPPAGPPPASPGTPPPLPAAVSVAIANDARLNPSAVGIGLVTGLSVAAVGIAIYAGTR